MKKLYTDIYPESKEDLIGSYWKCPWKGCNAKIKITEGGVAHARGNHGVFNSLEELYEFRLWDIKRLRKLFFGDEYNREEEKTI